MHSDLQELQRQVETRFGRPRTDAEQAEAISLCDRSLIERVAAAAEIRKATPRRDFVGYGGTRGGGRTDVADDAPVELDRLGEALDKVSSILLEGTRQDVETARADFGRGRRPLAKTRGLTAAHIAAEFRQLADLLGGAEEAE